MKRNLLIAAIAMLAFAASAFTFLSEAEKESVTLKFRFPEPTAAHVTDAAYWDDVSAQQNPESCDIGTELPCLVIFEDTEYASIEAYLAANNSLTAIMSSPQLVSAKE